MTKAADKIWLTLSALFFFVLGARLWLIAVFGSAMPFWDCWDGEALEILKPWRDGTLRWGAFFYPHAEHRIVFTRLTSLWLTAWNGQWDADVEAVFSALLVAALAVMLVIWLRRALAARWQKNFALLAVAVVFAQPSSWENTLLGFQSQFFFLIGFSLLALWGLGLGRPGSWRWWLGVAGGVLAQFSMGSGLLAAAAIFGWEITKAVRARRWPNAGAWATIFFCVLLLALGWSLRVDVPQHAVLRVMSVSAWLVAVGRLLAWPWVNAPVWWALFADLPLAALAARWFFINHKAREANAAAEPTEQTAAVLLLLGLWIFLQIAAMAYARGNPPANPPSRYHDVLALGAAINVLAAVFLVTHSASPGTRLRRGMTLGVSVWLLGLLTGFGLLVRTSLREELPEFHSWTLQQESNVRGFLHTGDRNSFLLNKSPRTLPYPNIELLEMLLRDPAVRALLPANVREPLRFEGVIAVPGFEENWASPATPAAPPGEPSLGTFDPRANDRHGALATADLDHVPLRSALGLPYLQFTVAGDLGERELTLVVSDAPGQHRAAILPSRHPGDHWRADYFPSPVAGVGGSLFLHGEDHSTAGWFAFREPVEVGRLSYWSGWLLRRGWLVCSGGAAVLAACLCQSWLKENRRRQGASGTS